jgi:hypothetical protein
MCMTMPWWARNRRYQWPALQSGRLGAPVSEAVVTADNWGVGGIIVKHLLIAGLLLAMHVAALAEPNLALYELQERCGKLAAEGLPW